METIIINAKIVTESEVLDDGYISFSNEKICSIGHSNDIKKIPFKNVIDANGGIVLPGFIDNHVHGGNGYDFMDADKKGLDEITRFHLCNGTTTLLATTVSAPKEELDNMLSNISSYKKDDMPYAQILGIHMEGPFFNIKKAGGQNPDYFVLPNINWFVDWGKQYPGLIRIIALAPELPRALELIEFLSKNNIVVACGHTDANYEDIHSAVTKGLTHSIHTFNAMKELHHREPGTVGAVLFNDKISAEVIADGVHVHPACIKILTDLKTQNNLLLITDCIPLAGLGDGKYIMGGREITIQHGIVRLSDGTTLSGSTSTMIEAFRFMVNKVGISILEASKMASFNPALLLGCEKVIGSLDVGKRADLLLLSSDLQIKNVWVSGTMIL